MVIKILVLLSYHPIFLRPYHSLKLVSFLGTDRTKSASVCPWLLRGAIQMLKYNTIQYKQDARFKRERNKGRPNLCWIDNVNESIASLGLTLKKAMDFTHD